MTMKLQQSSTYQKSSSSIPWSPKRMAELSRWNRLKTSLLAFSGVALAKNGKSVLDYNPQYYQAGFNFMLIWSLLPGFLNRAHLLQLLFLIALQHAWCWFVCDTDTEAGEMTNDLIIGCYQKIASLSRFVLGLFVSLVLSRTYYVNREYFDIVMGGSIGVTQMIGAWVRRPSGGTDDAVRSAQRLLVRWINVALHLMLFEHQPGKDEADIAEEIVQTGMLTKEEWRHLEHRQLKFTHVYQWCNNCIQDLFKKGYISEGDFVVRMHTRIDAMRGNGPWGYPSVPFTYTQMITHMVKIQMIFLALADGVMLAKEVKMDGTAYDTILGVFILHLDVILEHYLFQGLLDLHGALYNPNLGLFLGHMPAVDFVAWTWKFCEELLEDSTVLYHPGTLDLPTAQGVTSLETI